MLYKTPRNLYDADRNIAEQQLYEEGQIDQINREPNQPHFEFKWMLEAYLAGRQDADI